jgi:DNA-binding MarR family transcriptional regulator
LFGSKTITGLRRPRPYEKIGAWRASEHAAAAPHCGGPGPINNSDLPVASPRPEGSPKWSAEDLLDRFSQLHAQISELLAVPMPTQESGAHVTQHQVAALEALGTDGLPMSQFAASLGLSSGSATSLADRLVRAGLAERELDDRDRRIVRLTATESGQTLRVEHKQRREAALADLGKRFSGDRLVPVGDCAAELLRLLAMEIELVETAEADEERADP